MGVDVRSPYLVTVSLEANVRDVSIAKSCAVNTKMIFFFSLNGCLDPNY